MLTKNKISIVAILVALLLVAAGWYFLQPSNSTTTKEIAVETVSVPVVSPAPDAANGFSNAHSAAAAVRSQRIASANTEISPKLSTTVPSNKSSTTAPADTSKLPQQRRTPQELIERFLTDDPTQVFTPESVRYHAAVDAEAVDPQWGPPTQTALQDYLRVQFGSDAELVTADCRTDLCELHVVMSSNDDNRFGLGMKALKSQPWWNELELDQETSSMTFEDGRLVVVYFFSRK